MNIITYKYKLKNGNRKLNVLTSKVNYVWNYCNQISYQAIKRDRKFLSEFDLNNLTSGTSKVLGINSTTIQSIAETYIKSRNQVKKTKLNWRHSKGSRKSLGWIPFKGNSIKIQDNTIIFMKTKFKFIKTRELIGDYRCGSFVQDSCGDWYVCLIYKIDSKPMINNLSVGIDLGLKSLVTTSDGQAFTNPKLTNKYKDKLAMSQRSNNKKKTARIHRKIARVRKDNLHKISSILTKTYSTIVVGNLKLKSAKQTNDASFRGLIPLLKYKASMLGGTVLEVNEAYSTKTCNTCLDESGPSGLSGLSVREWTCGSCGQIHERDINAAKNILVFGYKHLKTSNELQTSSNEELLGGAR
jgi:putative transposase